MTDEGAPEEEAPLNLQIGLAFYLLRDQLCQNSLLGEVLGRHDDTVAAQEVAPRRRPERDDQGETYRSHAGLTSAKRLDAGA